MRFNLPCLLPFTLAAAAYSNPSSNPSAPYLNSTSKTDVASHINIQQKLAQFELFVDSKNYTMLSDVFTPNATFDPGAPTGPLNGFTAIKNWLQTSLVDTDTQHDFGTQYIDVHGQSASAVTYFVATFVGVGPKNGSMLVNHAKYLDTLEKSGDGVWRISNKTLIYMVSKAITLVRLY
jgi:ketosteroid isomerase-like protein